MPLTHTASRKASVATALIGLALTASPSWSAPIVEKPNPLASAERLRKELDQIISLELENVNLRQALAQLRTQSRLNIVIDAVALAQAGVDADDTMVTIKVKEVKVKSCLRAILAGPSLCFAPIGDSVLVTTEDMAIYRQLRQRVDLDVDGPLAPALKALSRQTGVNLLLDPKSAKVGESTVSLQLEDVPLDAAVRMLAETVGLKPVRVGNVLYLTAKANAAELRGEAELAPFPAGRQVPPGAGGANMAAETMAVGGAAIMIAPAAAVPVAPPAVDAPKEEKKEDKKEDKKEEKKDEKSDEKKLAEKTEKSEKTEKPK
jgi:hypothetical protein